jgi:hypothetical protein
MSPVVPLARLEPAGIRTACAAGFEASIAIWVPALFREQHRAAIDFLHRMTTDDMLFFGVEARLFRAGAHHAPQFDVIAKRDECSRGASEGRRAVEASPNAQAWEAYLEFSGPKAKKAFDRVRNRLAGIEKVAGLPVTWDRRDDRKGSDAWVAMPGKQSRSDEAQRAGQIAWLTKVRPALEATVRPELAELDQLDFDDADLSLGT